MVAFSLLEVGRRTDICICDRWVFATFSSAAGDISFRADRTYAFVVSLDKTLPKDACIKWDFGTLGKFTGVRTPTIYFPDVTANYPITVKVCSGGRVLCSQDLVLQLVST